ncbi:ribonuclease HII [Geomicrobium sp. JCM 19037]|uniref:ribonuclease HII n=1 Tax=Geomicrobium sp. JCM 19037 TaxID=1460634 RepID=UPI00045F4A12|nr:ribonuclease HII [Geomicrobium sp. JCM 19037]GAK04694.1 ribonuclease HII [Geomicrobium sp. JCM 19037]
MKAQLFEEGAVHDENWLKALRADERKGIQKLLSQYDALIEKQTTDLNIYTDKRNEEYRLCRTWNFAGIDEVGRGPLAGPVTTAAVIIPEHVMLPGIDDSKKLSQKERARLYTLIMETCVVGIGEATVEEIDEINIYYATQLAMKRAIETLPTQPDHLLVDAMTLPVPIRQTSLTKGDQHSAAIAAASIVAKETRDRFMRELHERFPVYGFDQHVGYGTKRHLDALDDYGPSSEHRLSFRPVAERLL